MDLPTSNSKWYTLPIANECDWDNPDFVAKAIALADEASESFSLDNTWTDEELCQYMDHFDKTYPSSSVILSELSDSSSDNLLSSVDDGCLNEENNLIQKSPLPEKLEYFPIDKSCLPRKRFSTLENLDETVLTKFSNKDEIIAEMRELCKWGKEKALSKHNDFNYLMGKLILKFGFSNEIEGDRYTDTEKEHALEKNKDIDIVYTLKKAFSFLSQSPLPAAQYNAAYIAQKLVLLKNFKSFAQSEDDAIRHYKFLYNKAFISGYKSNQPLAFDPNKKYSYIFIGEGDFSFSKGFTQKLETSIERSKVIASAYDSDYLKVIKTFNCAGLHQYNKKKWIPSAFHNIKTLEKKGACILFKVDATSLHTDSRTKEQAFSLIQFNMPYSREKKTADQCVTREQQRLVNKEATQQLIYNFLESCSQGNVMNKIKGEIRIIIGMNPYDPVEQQLHEFRSKINGRLNKNLKYQIKSIRNSKTGLDTYPTYYPRAMQSLRDLECSSLLYEHSYTFHDNTTPIFRLSSTDRQQTASKKRTCPEAFQKCIKGEAHKKVKD